MSGSGLARGQCPNCANPVRDTEMAVPVTEMAVSVTSKAFPDTTSALSDSGPSRTRVRPSQTKFQPHRRLRYCDGAMRARFIRGRAGFAAAARGLAFAALLIGTLLIGAERNAAADEALPFALSYQAAATCPAEAEFRALLAEKLSAAPGADHSAIRGAFVRLSDGTSGFIGRLELTPRDGTSLVDWKRWFRSRAMDLEMILAKAGSKSGTMVCGGGTSESP